MSTRDQARTARTKFVHRWHAAQTVGERLGNDAVGERFEHINHASSLAEYIWRYAVCSVVGHTSGDACCWRLAFRCSRPRGMRVRRKGCTPELRPGGIGQALTTPRASVSMCRPRATRPTTNHARCGFGAVRASLGYWTLVASRAYVSEKFEASFHSGAGPAGYRRPRIALPHQRSGHPDAASGRRGRRRDPCRSDWAGAVVLGLVSAGIFHAVDHDGEMLQSEHR